MAKIAQTLMQLRMKADCNASTLLTNERRAYRTYQDHPLPNRHFHHPQKLHRLPVYLQVSIVRIIEKQEKPSLL